MPEYDYRAVTSDGECIAGCAEVTSLPALAAELETRGQTVVSVSEAAVDSPRVRGIPYFEVIGMYRQIAASIEAGLPVVEAIGIMSSESRNLRLKSLLYFLQRHMSRGHQLSQAMRLFPQVFPSVHVAIVRAGEQSGRLGKALDDLAEQAEAVSNMNRRFASSLVYPTVIALAAFALLNFGFIAVVPRMRDLFNDLGVQSFSTITQVLFFVSRVILPVTILLSLGLAIAIAVILAQRQAASGRLRLDRWKLRLPIVGQIAEKAALSRFCSLLGLLLDAGVELPRALNLAAGGAGNRIVERLLRRVAVDVETGLTLSESLDLAEAIPASLSWRIGVGEETGDLAGAFSGAGRLYAKQVDSLVTSFAGLLEPLLIIIIGSAVAMLVLGMFLPIAAVINALTSATGY